MTGSPEFALDSLNISWRFLIVNGLAPREGKDESFDFFEIAPTKHDAMMMVANKMMKKRRFSRTFRPSRNAHAKEMESSSFFFFCDVTNNGCRCGSSGTSPVVVVPLVVVVVITHFGCLLETTMRCSFVYCARVLQMQMFFLGKAASPLVFSLGFFVFRVYKICGPKRV